VKNFIGSPAGPVLFQGSPHLELSVSAKFVEHVQIPISSEDETLVKFG